jgi:primosomal protein N''
MQPRGAVPLPTALTTLEELLHPSEMDVVRCRAGERNRPPHWRWNLAVFTVSDSRVSPYFELEVNDTVKRAQAMLPELLRGTSLATLAETFPAEVEAIRLRVASESRQRWELEARILANNLPRRSPSG